MFSLLIGLFFDEILENIFLNILELSSFSTVNIKKIDSLIPLSFSFMSGMIATVNPCGFVMLPVYISMFLSINNEKKQKINITNQILKSFQISFALGLGFVSIFGSVGLAISWGILFIQPLLSWLTIIIGFSLVILGIYTFSGKSLYLSFPQNLSSMININTNSQFKNFFLYGLSYGIASISCTLPLFIALISNSISTGGFLNGIKQFISYSFGMTSVILIITLLASFLKNISNLQKTSVTKWYKYLSGILISLVGIYLIIYWLNYDLIG
ncbi:MAG: hypothetical protein CL780_00125 [Chloroflexi bacterium]|nr:hypothetical protein [Chloroflexota bacterium]